MSPLSADTNLIDPDLVVTFSGPPNELFKQWRSTDPVHWNPPNPDYICDVEGWSMDRGFWVLTRHADVERASRDNETFSVHEASCVIWDLDEGAMAVQRAGLMGMDPPQHTGFKRLVMPQLMMKSVNRFVPEIQRVATEIIDDVIAQGNCEFVFDVASKLPVYTFCVLMGIPEEERDRVWQLGNQAADQENRSAQDEDPFPALFEIAGRLAMEKAANPDDSMLSAYVNGEIDGERLAPEQVAMFFLTVAIAGHETTRNTLAHFMRLMAEHPDQYEMIRNDPDQHLSNAIDEVLRHAPPVLNFRRTAMVDTELSGQAIKAGDKVYLAYAAANRDPEVFEDPETFDITRTNARKHLSFGTGVHVCSGAQVARTQLDIMLREIMSRIGEFSIDGELEYMRNLMFSTILKMPINFTPQEVDG